MDNLNDKAINIKGKEYVLVKDRVLYFNNNYPDGSIFTQMLSESKSEMVIFIATVIPNSEKPDRKFTGHSQAKWGEGNVNKTSALENAETSAVGRALAMMGIGVISDIASADEIQKERNQWVSKYLKEMDLLSKKIPPADYQSILLGYGINKLEDVASRDDAEGIYHDVVNAAQEYDNLTKSGVI